MGLRGFAVAALGALALAGGTASWAQGEEPADKKRFYLGPQLGVFLPTAGGTRDRFGGTWTNIGFGIGPVAAPRAKGEWNLDFTFLSSRGRSFTQQGQSLRSRALVIPVGAEYRLGTSADTARGPRPYVGASIGGALANVESQIDGLRSTWRTGAAASAFVGVVFNKHGYVEAHYYQMQRIAGFDFSGLNLAAGYRF